MDRPFIGRPHRNAIVKLCKSRPPNVLHEAQVLPPHQVDLTLVPTRQEEIRVPVDISGSACTSGKPSSKNTK